MRVSAEILAFGLRHERAPPSAATPAGIVSGEFSGTVSSELCTAAKEKLERLQTGFCNLWPFSTKRPQPVGV
jgi:hypothetical protein